MLRRGRKSAAQTPAPAKDRIYGSKTNPKGSASSGKSGNSINLSDKTVLLLRKKLKEFKEKHPTKNNITLGDLKAVYRRGLGAYSSTHRPFITGGAPNSRSAWATARVNKFLLKAGGTKVKAAYVQDDDLMAKGGQTEYADGGLIAPNGNPSNLTPEQYELVRTPEFKAWFGDWENNPEQASKVVDENGEPMVMWHFSKRLQNLEDKFYIFNVDRQIGTHFGTTKQAKNLKYIPSGKKEVEKPNEDLSDFRYYQVFLNIKKPIRLKDEGIFDENFLIDAINNIDTLKDYEWEYVNNYSRKSTDKLLDRVKKIAKDKGIDGVVYLNRYESEAPYIMSLDDVSDKVFLKNIPSAEDSWIAFYPNQIKLADGTNTTFDAENPDIRFADGGNLKQKYIGSCVDVGGNKKEICKYFADATTMATYVGNPDEDDWGMSKELNKDDFYKYIDASEVPSKAIKGKHTFHYIDKGIYAPEEAAIFFIYNWIQDIHYFFKRGYSKEKGGKLDGGTFNDAELLRKYKAGESIGFTAIAHLKAKGLIPRADGTKRKSDKYKEDGGEINTNSIKLPELDMQYENLKKTLDYQGYVLEPKLAKGGKLKGSGDCYLVAGKIAMGDYKDIDFIGTPYVVHAEVEGQGKISGIKYGHAWVEDDVNVYDYSNGNEFVLPKMIYYAIGNIKTDNPKKYRRYTFDQARLKMLETKNYGCWDLDVKYDDGGETETITDTVNLRDFESKIMTYKRYIDNQVLEKTKDKSDAMVKVITKHFDDLERKNIIYVLGGNTNGQDLEDISKKHNKSIEFLLKQYFKGLQDELVHVKDMEGRYSVEDFKRISQIVLDHLEELPNYYEVNKVVEQKIEQQKEHNFDEYLKYLNTMIQLINEENIDLEKKSNEEDIDLEKLLTEEDEYMQQVNSYLKENNPNYLADGGETTIYNNSQQEEMVLEDYFEREKTLADALLLLNRTKIYKVMYCNKKIEYAEKEENMTESAYDKNAWNYVANIWKSTLGVIKAENTEYKHGGTTDCGCMHKYGKGGLAYGNSHDNGGIKATVASTGQSIEYEGGEGVINKRSMQIEKTYTFNGKKLTPCEIVSEINEMGGGVKFKCEDVKPIIANDGSYK